MSDCPKCKTFKAPVFTATVATCPKCGNKEAGRAHGYVHCPCGGAFVKGYGTSPL